uniref:Protein turtle homolog A-like n=1 Tax=Fundulus heteroclitus TaxID=8078 RepID=A0A3Q2NUQ2_FUNHE
RLVCLGLADGVSRGSASLVRAREGGSAELDCSLTPTSKEATTPNLFPLHVVEWVRLGYNVPVLIKFGVYAPRVHPNYKGRVSLTRGASLLVERLTLEDEGWFECRILLLDSKTDSFRNGTWTFLSITAPPVFIKKPPTFVEVLLGDSLTLSCGAHGNPRPTVVWHKDESPVLNGTLSLATVTRNVSGVYKCHVSNSEGNLTHYTQLQVQGPPIIIISPEDTTLNMSQDAVLQCQADAYPSNLTYEWLKQGQNVYHIESLNSRVKILVDGTLLIPNLIPEDAGNYTCIPTNGILTPPSASAHLKVKHPARVGRMLRETYLPAGMEGVIYCPVQADPPVLYVNWTKDGNELKLDNFPGWMVNSEGSVFIATANDNAVGMYTCTPYNSYGTMGQSEPTKVILQDPPSFRVPPLPEYLQEVGRDLIIPCEASGDPAPNVTWSKIGPSPRSPYVVLSNGSLLLQPLSKDHHGGWECLATNRVATVSAGTVVFALGTSPHAVSSVTVNTEMNQANVSWLPGFDGGFTQKFTVWSVAVKQSSRGKHEWASLPVPTSKNYLLVTGLLAGTGYQFSVLPQNKLGSGPFSEIVSVRTKGHLYTLVVHLAVPTEVPKAATGLPALDPPTLLSANRTGRGVLLQWQPPEAPLSPLTGFVLQARRDRGQWVIIGSNIHGNQSQVLVQGLLRDSMYDLRLMSRSNKALSEPSDSVSVSTEGMDIYPLRPGFLEVIPQPLMAGVIGGACFLFLAIILSVVTACYMSNRRRRRRRKRRQGKTHILPLQGTSGFYAELEREGVRTRSRRSDKCLFPDSLSPVSTLTLVEEVEVDQSQFSAPRMSDSFKAEPAAPSPKMSPHQTSAILEYLSLPGFIEMSVDEPAEEVQGANTSERGSEQKPEEDSVVAKPDVVPRNWEVHVQENKETASGEKQAAPLGAAPCSFDASKRQGSRRSPHVETRVRFPDDPTPSSSAPEPTSRALYDEKTRTRAGNICTGRLESRLGSRSSHALFSAAKSVADIVSKHSQGYLDSEEFSPEQPQRQASQGSRTNKIVSRITQAPVPFLKKSLSLGPCRTLSGVAQPRPYLKKSISLGSQRWEHFETPRTYISEKCFWDEFPSPDVRVKSYSLGRTPPSLPPPGPCWREYVPFRRPSMGSLERPHHAPRSLASPSYLTPMYPPRQTSVSPMLEPSDPRRQAAIFPESSRWCPSYQDTLRPVQHQYVSNLPYYQDWPDPRGESLRHLDARIGPPRSYLPRGISWPSPYYAAFPPREGDSYRHPDRMMGRGGDADVREGGRASFASQSSGRGSAGLFRQSLSITPTLLSSPETTEEHERLRAEMELAKRRVKR